jgi:hypothetical protein
MSSMRRRLFTACSALSLLMGIIAAALWARSRTREDVLGVFFRTGPESNLLLDMISLHGGVSLTVQYTPRYSWELIVRDVPNRMMPGVRWSGESRRVVNSDWGGGPPPLRFDYGRDDLGRPSWHVFFRCWVVLVGCAVLPLVGTWKGIAGAVKRSRQGTARCRVCGYDLRATPGRCPECGTAVVGVGEGSRGRRGSAEMAALGRGGWR